MVTNRTSRGLIEELNELVYNLMAVGDHLLDLPPDKLEDALERIDRVNAARQQIVALFAKGDHLDMHYHCAYKHALKAIGICKESIIAVKRAGDEYMLKDLLIIYNFIREDFIWVLCRYLRVDLDKMPLDEFCVRCLDDIL